MNRLIIGASNKLPLLLQLLTEDFSRGVTVIDPIGNFAEAAADLTVSLILNPQRAARLVQYHAEDPQNPDLNEVIQKLLNATWKAALPGGLGSEVARTVNYVVLTHLMALALDNTATPAVRSAALSGLRGVKSSTVEPYAMHLFEQFERDPKSLQLPKLAEAPPGQPIGDDEDFAPFMPSPAERIPQ